MTERPTRQMTPDELSGVPARRPRGGREATRCVHEPGPACCAAETEGPVVRYGVLGQLEVIDSEGPVALGGRRQQLVLAVLLDHAGERVSVDRLIDAVWGDGPPPSARRTIQSYVSRLRSGVTDAIETIANGYRLEVGGSLDAARFERLATEGRQLLNQDPAAARGVLREALGLWRGAPYGSLGDEPALRPSRQQLLERRLEVTEARTEADLAAGHHDGLVAELRALTADHPLREPLHGLLMRTLYLQGRQGDALEVARQLRARVADELGLEPSPEIDALQRRILEHDPSLRSDAVTPPVAATATNADMRHGTTQADGLGRTLAADRRGEDDDIPTAVAPENPYCGLRAFGEGEAALFFGRDELVDELIAEVVAGSLVLVVGPSGSGKSSVVRAGLLPAVRERRPGWTIATIVPGTHPFAEFEAALVRAAPDVASVLSDQLRGDDLDLLRVVLTAVPDDGHVLLVVDQLEELFLLSAPGERDRFVRGLVELVDDPHDRVTVVATIRADFLNRPLQHPTLGPYVEPATALVPPLEPAQLEAACVEPARTVGVSVAPQLVTEIVADVASEPGALPLFQYTLTQLFDARDGGPLTLAGYRALGGLRGSLVRRADELLAGLDDEGRDAARQVFLRLVTIGEGTEDTRRRTRRSELAATSIPSATLDDVLTTFGNARLLSFDHDAVTGGGTVEVAHESLLREWPVLRAWIDEARDDLRLRHQLTTAAREWDAAGRDDDFLLAGSRIVQVEEHLAERSLDLTVLEAEFVAASRAHQDAVEAAEQERREHEEALEVRARRRLRQLVAVFAVAAVVASALGIVAVDRAADLARQRDLQLARQLGDLAAEIGVSDPEFGLLLALHAAHLDHSVRGTLDSEIVADLHWALQAARVQFPDDLAFRAISGPLGAPRGIFELDVPDLVALARDNVTRDLTADECEGLFVDSDCPDPLPASFGRSLDGAQPEALNGLDGTTVRLWGNADWTPQFENATSARSRAVGLATGGVRIEVLLEPSFSQTRGPGGGQRPSQGADPGPETAGGPGGVDMVIVEPAYRIHDEAIAGGGLLDVRTWLPLDDVAPGLLRAVTADEGGSGVGEPLVGAPTDMQPTNLVWYQPEAFDAAGYQPPSTFAELSALTDRMVQDGRTPWCLGLAPGYTPAGYHAATVLDVLVMAEHGPTVHDAWTDGEIRFSDPQIAATVRRFADMHLRPGRLAGGVNGALSMSALDAMRGPIDDGAFGDEAVGSARDCMMSIGISRFGEEYPNAGHFVFPPIAARGIDTMVGVGYAVVPLTDRPEVRAVLRALTTRGVTATTLEAGRWSFPVDMDFEPQRLPTNLERVRPLADSYGKALSRDRIRFGAVSAMPEPVSAAFQAGMADIVREGPQVIDEILARIDAAWPDER